MTETGMRPTEAALAQIWTEVLGRPVTSAGLDFFRTGGDSLLATRAMLRIRRRWRVKLTVQAMIDKPVLADFADEIDRLAGSAG